MAVDFKQTLADIQTERKALSARMGVLDKAEKALASLADSNGSASAPTAETGGEKPSRGPGRPPAQRGRGGKPNRTEQTFDLIKSNPGISIPEIAQKLKIEPNYLYRVVPNLANQGRVRKDETTKGGWVANAA